MFSIQLKHTLIFFVINRHGFESLNLNIHVTMIHSNSNFWTAIFLLFSFSLLSNEPLAKEAFISGSFLTAKEEARMQGKSFFAVFETNWCEPCQWMDANTFNDERVDWYIRQNTFGVKVNVDNFDGYSYRQVYKLEQVPTIIAFNAEGRETERLDKPVDADAFLAFLKRNSKKGLPSVPSSSSSVIDYLDEAPVLVPPSDTPSQPDYTYENSSGNRFTVQLGAFSRRSLAFSEMERLDGIFGEAMMFHNEYTNGKQWYKLSIGIFKNKEDAEKLKNEIRNRGFPDAWVKTF